MKYSWTPIIRTRRGPHQVVRIMESSNYGSFQKNENIVICDRMELILHKPYIIGIFLGDLYYIFVHKKGIVSVFLLLQKSYVNNVLAIKFFSIRPAQILLICDNLMPKFGHFDYFSLN